MKKSLRTVFASILLALALVFAFVGCSSEPNRYIVNISVQYGYFFLDFSLIINCLMISSPAFSINPECSIVFFINYRCK